MEPHLFKRSKRSSQRPESIYLTLKISLSPELLRQQLTDVAVHRPRLGHGAEVCRRHHGALQDEPFVRRLNVDAGNDVIDADVDQRVCQLRHFRQVAEVQRQVGGQDATLDHGQGG